MNIDVVSGSLTEISCDTMIINLFEGEPLSGAASLVDKALNSHLSEVIHDIPGCAKYAETTVVHTFGAIGAKRILLLGFGKESKIAIDKVRALMAVAMRTARKTHSQTVATIIHSASDKLETRLAAQAVSEGAVLGLYQFKYYKTSKKTDVPGIEKVLIVENDTAKVEEVRKNVQEGKIIAESVNLARDMVNHPAQYMTPTRMACQAAEIAEQYGFELSILEKEDMQNKGMGALLAVAQGSVEPPKLIVLKYQGNPESQEVIALVGKAITFDSGGISLKPSQKMDEMKGDMAGGAAVLGAMMAMGQLKPKVNVIAVVPCTENMPSGSAFRPGDILTSLSGKTIEVLSTDAEGRLILADAVTYAKQLGATKIIDLATLTGACVIGLGTIYSGVLTNDQEWCQTVITAGNQIGEKMWQLPNDDEYLEQIKSSIADLKNTGGRPGGTITAGLFIGQFAEKTPWVHIDIAGTSDTEKDKGYNLKGGTGVGVRSIIEVMKTMSKS